MLEETILIVLATGAAVAALVWLALALLPAIRTRARRRVD